MHVMAEWRKQTTKQCSVSDHWYLTSTIHPVASTHGWTFCNLSHPSHTFHIVNTIGWFKILIFWSWDLNTSHLIWTALMIISSYSEDFCHLLPLRASHRKFSGTVGDIENRTSPNPPFMGIQTSVCGHWSQRCMISGVLTCFCAQKRQKTMKNDYFPENSHFLQFFSIFRY